MIQHQEISRFFETQYPLHQGGLDELLSLFATRTYDKGFQISQAGNSENQLRFLNSGIVREYYTSTSGETNINFYTKPQFITDLSAFIGDTKTKRNQECLSKVELLTIPKNNFLALLEKHECGKSLIDISFQKLLKSKELLEFNRVTKTAEELYQDLFQFKPDWLRLIPQYHIASYLNITPETLSRIRKRIS